MLTIPLAFFLVMLEFSAGSFLVLYALNVRNDSSINFMRLQAFINFLFTLLAWATMNGFTTVEKLKLSGYNLDYHWLSAQGSLIGWFLILQIPYSIVLWFKSWRVAHIVVGGVVMALAIASLLVVGMGYRSLYTTHLDGTFTVASFISGALALGGVSTAMLLGHWYLNTPTASGKPLEFATTITIVGFVAQIAFGLLGGTSSTYVASAAPAVTPTPVSVMQTKPSYAALVAIPQGAKITPTITVPITPTPTKSGAPLPSGVKFDTLTLILLQYLLGLGLPLVVTVIALRLEKERSFQSATGMLYVAMVFVFFGEILARNLFLGPLNPS